MIGIGAAVTRRPDLVPDGVEAIHLPARLQDLTPAFASPSLLNDPWGNAYKYLQQPSRYLVIGFTPDGKPDTDLFLQRGIEAGATASAPTKQEHGGITLID